MVPTPTGPSTDADGSYTISWSSSSEASSYQLQENYDGGSWSTVYNSSGTSTTRSSRDPGTWNYRVRATSAVGSSSYSSTITVLVAPAVPGTPTGPSTDYNGSYTISWTAVTGASSYTLQEQVNSGTWSTIYTGSGTSLARTGRTAGTWGYRVRACGATCSAYSATKSVVVTVPTVPTLTGPSSDIDGSYTISWTASSEASSYTLQESLDGGTWSTVYSSSDTSTTRTGRTVGTWSYRVNAYSSVGYSAYSGTLTVEVLPPAVPGVPSGPSADPDGSYTINWGAVSGADTYQLQENFNDGSWSTVYDGSSLSTDRTDRDPGTWNYRLRSCNDTTGCSAYSSPDLTVLVAPPVPDTPSGPTGTEYDGEYTITWNSVTGAVSYQVDEQLDSGTWSTIYDGSSTSVSRSGQSAGIWGYRVRAYGVTYSAYSGVKNVTVAVPSTPGTPTGPATDDDGSFTISWTSVTGATSYTLQERIDGGSFTQAYSGSATTTSLTSRTDGDYDYRVNACSAVGCSSYSGNHTVVVDIPRVDAVYTFDYDDNGNMTNMNEPE